MANIPPRYRPKPFNGFPGKGTDGDPAPSVEAPGVTIKKDGSPVGIPLGTKTINLIGEAVTAAQDPGIPSRVNVNISGAASRVRSLPGAAAVAAVCLDPTTIAGAKSFWCFDEALDGEVVIPDLLEGGHDITLDSAFDLSGGQLVAGTGLPYLCSTPGTIADAEGLRTDQQSSRAWWVAKLRMVEPDPPEAVFSWHPIVSIHADPVVGGENRVLAELGYMVTLSGVQRGLKLVIHNTSGSLSSGTTTIAVYDYTALENIPDLRGASGHTVGVAIDYSSPVEAPLRVWLDGALIFDELVIWDVEDYVTTISATFLKGLFASAERPGMSIAAMLYGTGAPTDAEMLAVHESALTPALPAGAARQITTTGTIAVGTTDLTQVEDDKNLLLLDTLSGFKFIPGGGETQPIEMWPASETQRGTLMLAADGEATAEKAPASTDSRLAANDPVQSLLRVQFYGR